MQYSMGSNDTSNAREGGGPTRITDPPGCFAITWQRRRLALEKLDRVGISLRCGQQLLRPHPLGKSGEAWGGLGNDANGLDIRVISRAPLNVQSLGENPSTTLSSHGVFDWMYTLSMHSGLLPSDNDAEPSVSYDGGVMIYRRKSRAW